MRKTNPFIHEFYIDLRNGTTQQREKKSLSQGDAFADKIVVHVQEDEKDVDLDGISVSAKVIRYDGATVPLIGNVTNGAACIVLDPSCYIVPGDIRVSLALSAGDVVQTVLVLSMNVETSETSVIADNGTIGDLTEILSAIAEMRAATADANAAADFARETAESIAADVDGVKKELTSMVNSSIADMSVLVNQSAPSIVVDSSGALVHITDGADRPAVQVVSVISPTTEGVSAVTLTRTGRNLVSHLDYTFTQGHSGTVVTEDCIDVTTPTTYDYGNIPVQLKAGVTYTLVIDWEVYGRDPASTANTAAGYRLNPITSASERVETNTNGTMRIVRTYKCTADADGTIVWHPNYNSPLRAASRSRIMLLEGAYTADTAPAFEPCRKQTLAADFPETVYGGTLDWTRGLLTITHGADGAELADAVTRQLNPQTLDMMKGENNVWSDTGDTRLVYIADTKLYIDNTVAGLLDVTAPAWAGGAY